MSMVLCITKFVSWAFVSLRFRVGSLGNVFSQEPDCGAGFGLWLLVVEAGGYVRRRGVVGLLWKLDLKNTAAGFGQLCVCVCPPPSLPLPSEPLPKLILIPSP